MTWNHDDGAELHNLAEWLEHVRAAPDHDADQLIIISGDERKGKSTLAFLLAHKLNPDFDLKRCVFTADDFIREANQADPGSVVWMDESIDGGFSREAMSGANKALTKYLTVAGERNLIMFIIWPNWRWLDPLIRDHRAHWHLYIPRRGEADIDYPHRGKHQRSTFWERILRINVPKAEGAKWEAYLKHKHDYVTEKGRDYGSDDDEELTPAQEKMLIGEHVRRQIRPWAQQMAQEAIQITKDGYDPELIVEGGRL